MGQTSYRRHDFYLGLFMEPGKSTKDIKRKMQVRESLTRSNIDALVDGGLSRSSEEDSVMELERRAEVIQLEIPFTTTSDGRRIQGISSKGIPITTKMVWEAYQKVKKNKGSGGVDNQSLTDYEKDLSNNLYKLWNRLTSGSYFPSAVLEKEIPKKDGRTRKLGIPTISDRIGQEVVRNYLEAGFEAVFHENSYGYRPSRSGHQALEEVRKNTWKYDWLIDMDIKSFFDEVSHDLLAKAVRHIVPEKWAKMYIARWLSAPVQKKSGILEYREGKGTPQGGVISPLLSNLFLHYVFDRWLELNFPAVKFVRYADDIIVHCRSQSEAENMLHFIQERMTSCHLTLHEEKTKIVFCKKYDKESSHEIVKFDFLGFGFQPRPSIAKNGKMFLGYDCAISQSSMTKILEELRSSGFQNWTTRSIEEIAEYFNPKIRGWLRYYGRFRKRHLHKIFKLFHKRLITWLSRRYKRFKNSYIQACKWLKRFTEMNPDLFVHWKHGFSNA